MAQFSAVTPCSTTMRRAATKLLLQLLQHHTSLASRHGTVRFQGSVGRTLSQVALQSML